jgi:hypothetical protein
VTLYLPRAALFVGRTELGLCAVILVWRWGGVWRHRKLRIA